MTSKDKAAIAVTRAISWFCLHGYSAYVPVGENGREIDLVVISASGNVSRVQCKYTTKRHGKGYEVGLVQMVGRSALTNRYRINSFDQLFVSTPQGDYLVEWAEVCTSLGKPPSALHLTRGSSNSYVRPL